MYADRVYTRHNNSLHTPSPARSSGLTIAGRASARSTPYTRPAGDSHRSGRGIPTGQWGHDLYSGDMETGSKRAESTIRQGDRRPNRYGRKTKLVVENLHWEVLEDDIKELFGEFGTLVKAYLKYDRSGRSEGRAEVVFENPGDAAKALQALDNRLLDGQPLQIKFADPTPSHPSFAATGMKGKPGIFGRLGDKVNGGNGEIVLGGGHRAISRVERGRDRREVGRSNGSERTNSKGKVSAESLDAEMDTYMKDA